MGLGTTFKWPGYSLLALTSITSLKSPRVIAMRLLETRKPPDAAAKSLKEWSGRWDSNPRLQPWQGCALPLSYARESRLRRRADHSF